MYLAKSDIVIISYNTRLLLSQCIESLLNNNKEYINKIIVVDNCSSDDTIIYITQNYPDIELISNQENLGYANAVNIGVRSAESELIIISNSDVIFPAETVKLLAEFMKKSSEIGCSSAQQIFSNGNWQRSFGFYPGVKIALMDLLFISSLNNAFKKLLWKLLPIDRHPKYVEYLDGACLIVRKEAFYEIGGFDEDFFFYTEEADFCYRMNKSKWQVIFNPKAIIIHHRGGSMSANNPEMIEKLIASKILFCKKHYPEFHRKVFIKLEKYHSIIMKILWQFISYFFTSKRKAKAKSKSKFFEISSIIWRKNEKI